jgi:hypothetical protein
MRQLSLHERWTTVRDLDSGSELACIWDVSECSEQSQRPAGVELAVRWAGSGMRCEQHVCVPLLRGRESLEYPRRGVR